MTTYALLDGLGEIANCVTTRRSRLDVERDYPAFRVVPLDQVPDAICQRYRFWGERP